MPNLQPTRTLIDSASRQLWEASQGTAPTREMQEAAELLAKAAELLRPRAVEAVSASPAQP